MNKKILKNILITLLVGVILYYFMLPPLNFTSPLFYIFIFILVFIFSSLSLITSLDFFTRRKNIALMPSVGSFIILGGILLIIIINVIMSPLFQSKKYASRIKIDEEGNFTSDIASVDFNSLPLLDKDSSMKLGDRVMGQMPELVSQFRVSDVYTQINYNNTITRVTPLEYNGFIKYFANRKNGIKGYITVNSVDGVANLVKLDKGMRYMPSALFFEDLDRFLRIKYPTLIFEEKYFELDNDGNPYWVVPTVTYKGIGIRKEITGVVLVNPINGKTKKYTIGNIPTWIDHVYDAELVIEQVDDWGLYKKGFINSLFGQKGVVQTTDGYNYLVMNDDVYLYTGITSFANDESNLGFILTNLRTKETIFYKVPGAEEYSAMASAEGQVQQMKYKSTFPLLINLNGKPTYLVSLKDNAGLVKMYGFIDVVDYQKVVVSDAARGIEYAAKEYLNDSNIGVDKDKLLSKDIYVTGVKTAVYEGNTIYYLSDNMGYRYIIPIKAGKDILPFIEAGSTLRVIYMDGAVTEQNVIEVTQVEWGS